jgi:hypothetical protein
MDRKEGVKRERGREREEREKEEIVIRKVF